MKIVIAGGSGFLGQELGEYFKAKGHEIVILTRSINTKGFAFHYVQWDGKSIGDWCTELDGADVLINLSGRTVNCRYNQKNKQQIYDSRLNSTRVLGLAIKQCENPPKVWLNSSSATIYRSEFERPNEEENGIIGEGFSVDVCKQWEEVFFKSELTQTRKVALRSSLVLGESGSVLPAYQDLAKKGLGGTQGSGEQYVSWIRIEDYVRAIQFLIENELSGVVNVCAPNPVKNKEFMAAIRSSVGRNFGLRTYPWMVKLGAWFMGTEAELVMKSRRVVPKRLLDMGFKFRFPMIKTVLKAIT
jgi:uncharacterized protein (TIGR01777 family)